jgi:hypothetical protein
MPYRITMTADEVSYHHTDKLVRLEGENLSEPEILDVAAAFEAGVSVLPAELAWVKAAEVFPASLFADLAPGAVTHNLDGSITFDPALLPAAEVTIWTPEPLRPYVPPGVVGRTGLAVQAAFQWGDTVDATGVDNGTGARAGFGVPDVEGAPLHYLENGLYNHPSNSRFVIYSAFGSSAFVEQWNRPVDTDHAPGRYAWGSCRVTQFENATQCGKLSCFSSDSLDLIEIDGDVSVPKALTRAQLDTFLNTDLDASARWYLRLQGDPDWLDHPFTLHALCVR